MTSSLQNASVREHGARQGHCRQDSRLDIGRTADDGKNMFARVHLADGEPIAVGVLIDDE